MKRTLLKALTYRALGSGTTLLIAWAVTGNLPEATILAVIMCTAKVLGYVVHESAWDWISERRRVIP